MDYLISANILETLGLSWQKILLYLANFAVLALGLTFLLYRPIKKFMQKRQEEIARECDQANIAREEIEVIRRECEEQVNEAQLEIKKKEEEIQLVKKEAELSCERVIAEANVRAEQIVEEAREEAERYKQSAIEATRDQIVDMAVDLAGNILEREITLGDENKLVDDLIKEWEDDE